MEKETVTCFCCGKVVPEEEALVVDMDDDPDQPEHVCQDCFEEGRYHKKQEPAES